MERMIGRRGDNLSAELEIVEHGAEDEMPDWNFCNEGLISWLR